MSLEIGVVPVWRDTSKSTHDRVEALLTELTLEEKVGQLFGVWVGADAGGGEVAPHQNDMIDDVNLDDLLPHGIGQLTRPFGTAPVDPALGALSLQRTQERIVASHRLGIPAVAHEECLAGFATWGATAYPVPLAWGASFDPALVREMAARIGSDMRSVGVHQGLAPVLDVVRDQRWGRVEETIGEDPYLVATVGTAYVQGLEEAGIVATLKHFVGYSASKAGRNLAPVSIGPRELADVLLPPFEMALLEGGARSVMNSYTDLDGVPTAADRRLLTDLLRTTWGFEGTVVADYFAVGFLATLHRIVPDGDWAAAAGVALAAGIDVELPTLRAYGAPLIQAVRDGRVDEELVDRAVRRVLAQKIELGLLDPDWSPVPPALRDAPAARGSIDLDTADNRALAARIAERALVLLRNDGILPLAAPRRIAVVGPTADDPYAVLGGYAFPTHVGVLHPETPTGIALPTLLEAIRTEFPDSDVTFVRGTSIDGGETAEIPAAVAAARDADVVVLALGDRAGLFGRGTSGEGSDAEALDLPGAQQLLFDAMLGSGTPTVVALLAGRPYALGHAATSADAILEAFFLGEEGTTTIAGALSGRVNPAGRLPVSIPATPGAQPATYLAAPLARASGVSSIDPTPAFWFGHGLSYTTFSWTDGTVSSTTFTESVEVALTVTNTGTRAGSDVVQLYLHDPVASVVRPVQRLISFARVDLEPGQSARVSFRVPAELSGFTGLDGHRIVEPGDLVLGVARSAGETVFEYPVVLEGPVRTIDHRAPRHAAVTITRP